MQLPHYSASDDEKFKFIVDSTPNLSPEFAGEIYRDMLDYDGDLQKALTFGLSEYSIKRYELGYYYQPGTEEEMNADLANPRCSPELRQSINEFRAKDAVLESKLNQLNQVDTLLGIINNQEHNLEGDALPRRMDWDDMTFVERQEIMPSQYGRYFVDNVPNDAYDHFGLEQPNPDLFRAMKQGIHPTQIGDNSLNEEIVNLANDMTYKQELKKSFKPTFEQMLEAGDPQQLQDIYKENMSELKGFSIARSIADRERIETLRDQNQQIKDTLEKKDKSLDNSSGDFLMDAIAHLG